MNQNLVHMIDVYNNINFVYLQDEVKTPQALRLMVHKLLRLVTVSSALMVSLTRWSIAVVICVCAWPAVCS